MMENCVIRNHSATKMINWNVAASQKAKDGGLPDLSIFEKNMLYDYLLNCAVNISADWYGPLMAWKDRCDK